jgi:hypothetical protein
MVDVAEEFVYYTMAKEFHLKPEEVDKLDAVTIETWLTIMSEQNKEMRRK